MTYGKRPPLDEQKSLWEATLATEGVTTVAVSVATAFKGGQVPAGVPYKIVTFRFVPAEVAALAADVGDMADAATADDLSDVTTTSLHAKVRRLLLRMSSDAFSTTIQGAARTELDTILYQLATYITALGAAYSAEVNPGAGAKTNIEETLEDLGDILAGANGINTFPAAVAPADGVSLAEVIRYISDAIDALSVLSETGGTLTADGTEQNVVIVDAPASVFIPRKTLIDLSNMAAGDTTVIRVYYRIKSGGNYVLKDEVTYNGPVTPALINVELEPNRFGFKVTLEQTAGTNRDYDWEYLYED